MMSVRDGVESEEGGDGSLGSSELKLSSELLLLGWFGSLFSGGDEFDKDVVSLDEVVGTDDIPCDVPPAASNITFSISPNSIEFNTVLP